MAKQGNYGLGEEECKCLDRVLERTPEAIALAQECKECGWDMDVVIEGLEQQLATAKAAKARFFPNRT